MKLKSFKEKNNKKIGIILFTITCILLISGVILYRTFAIFETNDEFNVINGKVEDVGDIYFAFYKDGVIQKGMPRKDEGYVLDESQSYCGVLGENNTDIKVLMSEDEMIQILGVTTSRTKCNLYFVRGKYIQGKGFPVVEKDDGLYEVPHENVTNTTDNEGFSNAEYRFVGDAPNNYVSYNDELWRIIGLVNVNTENGMEQRLKIIKDTPIGRFSWNMPNYVNNWPTSTLMQMLNNEYYYSKSGDCYRDTEHVVPEISQCDFSKNDGLNVKGLNERARSMIDESIIWNIGGAPETYSTASASDWYNIERGMKVYGSNLYEWKKNNTTGEFHGIGLLYPSDYGYATNGGNMGRDECIKLPLNSWSEDNQYQEECVFRDWIKSEVGVYPWTIIVDGFTAYGIIGITNYGSVSSNYNNQYAEFVFPTLYLKSNVKIVNDEQDGSKDKPYHLQQIL